MYIYICVYIVFLSLEPKSQAPSRQDSKTNFYSKDTSQFKAHHDHRQQRNDRPPRFHRDTEFPKPGQEPSSISTSFQPSAQTQQVKNQEKWSRGPSNRSQNDQREMRENHSFPSSFPTTFTRSKDPQQEMDFSAPYHQRSRNGDGDGGVITATTHRRGLKDNEPASKMTNFAGNEGDGRVNNKRTDRRKGKNDRPNMDHYDRQRDAGAQNLNSKGEGSLGMTDEVGLLRDSGAVTEHPSHFQNGVLEHKRTGPIKPLFSSCPPTRDAPLKKNPANYSGPKRRSGQGRGQGRGPERSQMFDHSWKPGDQCMALYWEDSKVHVI